MQNWHIYFLEVLTQSNTVCIMHIYQIFKSSQGQWWWWMSITLNAPVHWRTGMRHLVIIELCFIYIHYRDYLLLVIILKIKSKFQWSHICWAKFSRARSTWGRGGTLCTQKGNDYFSADTLGSLQTIGTADAIIIAPSRDTVLDH